MTIGLESVLTPREILINAGGMIMKPAVIVQMRRVERRLCHSGTVPKLSSICMYGDKPPFELLSG
jgi:hypothetical protein